jgi:glycosyltransferase involved in cell wall biosynthesis
VTTATGAAVEPRDPAGATRRGLGVSVVLPVMDETWSLEQTVAILLEDNAAHVVELLVVVSPRTSAESLATIERLRQAHPALVRVHQQTLPYLGGALREAFALARGETTLMMASDLETDPRAVRHMIAEMERGGHDIVVASRWRGRRGFRGYSLAKHACNFLFQKFFATLYRVPLTDLTYGFRLYRTSRLQNVRWEELKHSFLFEALVKPLRLGCRVAEVHTVWEPRREGGSHNVLSSYAGYFRIGLRVLLVRPETYLLTAPGAGAGSR